MVTHQSTLTPILDFFPTFQVMITQQTDGTVHKLKPRLFHKSAHLQVHPADFHPSVNCTWHMCKNAAAPMIIMLGYLGLDTEVSNAGMETTESD